MSSVRVSHNDLAHELMLINAVLAQRGKRERLTVESSCGKRMVQVYYADKSPNLPERTISPMLSTRACLEWLTAFWKGLTM